MKRAAVYSSSGRRQRVEVEPPAPPRVTWREWRKRHARGVRWTLGIAAALLLVPVLWMLAPASGITAAEVEALVEKVLEAQKPPPSAADAYESILPSVVHVRGLPYSADADVENHNIRPVLFRCRQRRRPIVHTAHLMAVKPQNLADRFGRVQVVVYHEDLAARSLIAARSDPGRLLFSRQALR